MGLKFGYESKDNGWLQFKNIRVTKDAMLSRFSKIDDEGNLEIMGDLRVLYSCMMMVRLHIVRGAGFLCMKSLKIAIRYACVRRQFKSQTGKKGERKLMDYQTHLYKLGPILARAWIMQINGEIVAKRHEQLLKEIKEGNFELMDISHHFLSGYKSLFTEWTYQGIEDARIACGGAGFLRMAGFADQH
jgi:acyl-CoA oxidase